MAQEQVLVICLDENSYDFTFCNDKQFYDFIWFAGCNLITQIFY